MNSSFDRGNDRNDSRPSENSTVFVKNVSVFISFLIYLATMYLLYSGEKYGFKIDLSYFLLLINLSLYLFIYLFNHSLLGHTKRLKQ